MNTYSNVNKMHLQQYFSLWNEIVIFISNLYIYMLLVKKVDVSWYNW